MIFTHYFRPDEGRILKAGTPWLVYGRLTSDGLFTAIDGRKYPANKAVLIIQPNGRQDDFENKQK